MASIKQQQQPSAVVSFVVKAPTALSVTHSLLAVKEELSQQQLDDPRPGNIRAVIYERVQAF